MSMNHVSVAVREKGFLSRTRGAKPSSEGSKMGREFSAGCEHLSDRTIDMNGKRFPSRLSWSEEADVK